MLTMTQFISMFLPNFKDDTFKFTLKIEGIVVEGASLEDHLVPVVSSEHTQSSPAYFLKVDVEKVFSKSTHTYKINGALSSMEILYQQVRLIIVIYLYSRTSIMGCFRY